MARLSALLDQAGAEVEPGDTIPPYRSAEPPQLDTRMTQQLDQDTEGWAAFRRWQAEREVDERAKQARRIMRR